VPRLVALPVEALVDDQASGHPGRIIDSRLPAIVRRRRIEIASEREVGVRDAVDRPGVGIEQQPLAVEAVPGLRLVGSVCPEGIGLTGREAAQPDVPDVAAPVQVDRLRGPAVGRIAKQLEPDAPGVSAENREIVAVAARMHDQRQSHPRRALEFGTHCLGARS
jgi:hypothetical protein